MPRTPSWYEAWAAQIVGETLSVTVALHDDGTTQSMVDYTFCHADGRRVALEVVADVDEALAAQTAKLAKEGIFLSVLSEGWVVAGIDRTVKIKDLKVMLSRLLPAMEKAGLTNLNALTGQRREDLLKLVSDFGITGLSVDSMMAAGRVRVIQGSPFGGPVGNWRTCYAAFVEHQLDRFHDVPRKLLNHSHADERHAFIWATETSEHGVRVGLHGAFDVDPSMAVPRLPPGVTHVWIGGAIPSHRQGVIAWFPDRGWWRTDWSWPEHGVWL